MFDSFLDRANALLHNRVEKHEIADVIAAGLRQDAKHVENHHALAQELSKTRVERNLVKATVIDLKARGAIKDRFVESLRESIRSLEGAVAEKNTLIAGYSARNNELIKQTRADEDRIKELVAENKRLDRRGHDLCQQLAAVQAAPGREELESRAAFLSAAIAICEHECGVAKEAVKSARRDATAENNKVLALNNIIADRDLYIKDLRGRIDVLTSKLKDQDRLKLEAGKSYVAADGEIFGPFACQSTLGVFKFFVPGKVGFWSDNGCFSSTGNGSHCDSGSPHNLAKER